jgi:hypothetical protein
MGFEAISDVRYEWYDNGTEVSATSPANTITVFKDANGATQTYVVKPFWKDIEFPSYTVTLYPSSDELPPVADIRVALCPPSVKDNEISLTSYLDSLPYASAVQWTTAGAYPAISSTGKIKASNFPSHGVYTYTYARYSACSHTPATGKAYVHVVNGKIPPRRDTILICISTTESVNLNSIFGLEFGGEWQYPVNPGNIVSGNTEEINTPSQYAGMQLFNIKTAHQQATDAQYDVTYRGVTGKKFVIDYVRTTQSCNCNSGTTRIVIVSYE